MDVLSLDTTRFPFSPAFPSPPDGFVPKIDLITTSLPEDRTAYLTYGVTENPDISILTEIISDRVKHEVFVPGMAFMSGEEAGLEWRVNDEKISISDEWASRSHILTGSPLPSDEVDSYGQRISLSTRSMRTARAERYREFETQHFIKNNVNPAYGDVDEWVKYFEKTTAYLKSMKNGKTWSEYMLDFPV